MSIFDFKGREAVKIKAKLCKSNEDVVYKQFSIDPHITSYEVLQRILARAFGLAHEFDISYLATDDYGEQFYLPMLSDWDLDAAIFTSSDPILRIKVDVHPHAATDKFSILQQRAYKNSFEDADVETFGNGMDEPSYWESRTEDDSAVAQSDEPPLSVSATRPPQANQFAILTLSPSRSGNLFNASIFSQFSQHMEKTVNSVQRAIGGMKISDFDNQSKKPAKSPMNDNEFKKYLDSIGRLIMPREFKHSVYVGGLEPSLRKVGWRLLLDVYPPGLTGQERLTFLRLQSQQYVTMKTAWKEAYAAGRLSQQQISLIAGISMDVVRTDRTHNFYAGECRENSKVSQLFDLLVTYSLYHPTVGYSQGMSDLASPLLYIQAGEEGAAYVCFCALMRRIKSNFTSDGQALITKLQHLHDLLVYYDPNFAVFLRERNLADMFFAHRWLLLELKREFHFEDSLRVLEVQWAAIPQWKTSNADNGASEVSNVTNGLLESGISVETFATAISTSPKDPQKHNPYIRLQSLRRHSSGMCALHGNSPPDADIPVKKSVLPANSYSGHDLRLMNSLMGKEYEVQEIPNTEMKLPKHVEDTCENSSEQDSSEMENLNSDQDHVVTPVETSKCPVVAPSNINSSANHNHGLIVIKDGVVELPPPSELGYGNPFLLFLCLSLLLEYREPIMRTVHEMFDFAQFFRRLNQTHDLNSILARARHMFDEYIRDQETRRRQLLTHFPKVTAPL